MNQDSLVEKLGVSNELTTAFSILKKLC